MPADWISGRRTRRSALPVAICEDPVAMLSLLERTWLTTLRKDCCMWSMAATTLPARDSVVTLFRIHTRPESQQV